MICSIMLVMLAIGMAIFEVVYVGVAITPAIVLFTGGIVFYMNTIYIRKEIEHKKILREIEEAFDPNKKDSDCGGCSNCQ